MTYRTDWTPGDNSLPTKLWKCKHCQGVVEMPRYCNECYYDFCPNCGHNMTTVSVGDEVINKSSKLKLVVTKIYKDKLKCKDDEEITFYNGFEFGKDYLDFYRIGVPANNYERTGKHFDEMEKVVTVLNKIKKECTQKENK